MVTNDCANHGMIVSDCCHPNNLSHAVSLALIPTFYL
jgi:hypothetical protein